MLRIVLCLLLMSSWYVDAKPKWLQTDKEVIVEADFTIEKHVTGLKDAWGLAVLPDQRLLVTSRGKATVWLLDEKANSIQTLLEINHVYTRGQGGLFAIWVDNQFAEYPFVYIAKAGEKKGKNTTQLLRYRFVDDQLKDETLLFTALPWVDNTGHFGGAIAQDAQGHVYLSVGDRRQMDKPQSLDNHLGKVIKITRDGKPVEEPVADKVRLEIFSYGHRNPQGLVFFDNKLWLAEHGPQGGDEVNLVEHDKNYGWPVITYGEQYGGGKIGEGTKRKGMEQPLWYYVPSIATSDLALDNVNDEIRIFVASLKAGVVSQLHFSAGKWQEKNRLFGQFKERWRSIKSDGQGGFYLLAERGNLYRVLPRSVEP